MLRTTHRRLGLHRYGPVLRTPGAMRLLLAGLLGRAGHLGTGLAMLLAIHGMTGSFGVAGTAAAIVAVCASITRVVQGRLVDRIGAMPVLLTTSALLVAAASGFALASASSDDAGLALAFAALIGLTTPGIGAATRVLWGRLAPDPESRQRAYALDAMCVELSAMLGPAAAGILVTSTSASLAVISMSLLTSTGGILLALGDRQRGPRELERAAARLARPMVMPLVLIFGIGMTIGAIDVSVPAFAVRHGHPSATGLLLACWAVGSLLGGLWYGSRAWRAGVEARLLGCLVCVTLTCAMLPLGVTLRAFAALLVLGGLPLAPALTTFYLLVDRRVPSARTAEAYAWVGSAVPIGIALGTALGGWTIESASVSTALALAAALSAMPLCVVLLVLRRPTASGVA